MTNSWDRKKAKQSLQIIRNLFNPLQIKSFRTIPLSLGLLVVAGLYLSSCKKDPVEVGLGIQPREDMIEVLSRDTASIIAWSEINDSVRTDETALSLVGSYFDPVFGVSYASFYTQILLSKTSIDFGDNPEVDSMILSLAYAGYYGDLNTPLTFRIFELSEMLHYDSTYYSVHQLAYEPNEIASFTFYPAPDDSVRIDSVNYAPHLRINLSAQNPTLAEKILNGTQLELGSNDNFVEFVKGLYITADPVASGGSIQYFNLVSTLSKIELHYHNDSTDSLKYDLRLDTECARFNHFDHDGYASADAALRSQVVFGDTTLGAQTLYLQAMQGINTHFRLPSISRWRDAGPVAVTRAELVIPVLGATEDLPPPSSLLIGTYDEEGTLVQLIDYQEGASYWGGTYDSTRAEYRFRITRHVQQVINGERENAEMVLLVSGRAIQANRAVIRGPAGNPMPMRVEMLVVDIE